MNIHIFCQFLTIIVITSAWEHPLTLPKLNCTINGRTHNYLRITDLIYDTDDETIVPTNSFDNPLQTENVARIDQYTDNPDVRVNMENEKIFITFLKINEKEKMTRGREFHYNFVIKLHCFNEDVVNMYTTATLVDSNNHEPFFEKPTYTYNLISSFEDDLKRQMFLNPIIATDYDITNGEVQFTIEENKYFNIIYNGIVPNTLNKKHYALLVPKIPGALITEKVEVSITVIDVGNPPKQNVSKLIVNPPSPPKPIFDKTFYVGHYYKNNTFKIHEIPQLQEGTTYYQTNVEVYDNYDQNLFSAHVENGKILITPYNTVGNYLFYQHNYIACTIMATYLDPITNVFSKNSATLIIEFHHDL